MDHPLAFPAAVSRRIWASAAVALLGALVVPIPALAGPGSETFVTMISEPGDWIGAGYHRFFHTGNASITISGNAGYAGVGVSGGYAGDYFTLEFAAPPGQSLQVGEYERAQRAGFRTAGRPGIDISGSGRGCNEITGRFRVKHIAVGADGKVSSLWIVYEQHCEGGTAALFGEVRYRIPGDGGDITIGPREVRWPKADPGSSTRVFPVIVYNPGSQPVEVAESSLSGPGSGEFEVRNDECVGQILATGKICRVFVRYLAQTPGLPIASLTVPETDGTLHQVALEGFAYSGTTRFEMGSEHGDYVGDGEEYAYHPSNARISVAGDYEYVRANISAANGDYWHAGFAPRPGDVLAPGTTYTGAAQLGYTSSAPGMDIGGNGTSCSRIEGEFTVTEIQVSEYGELERFGVVFEQYCEGSLYGLTGVLEFRVDETVGALPRKLIVAVSHTGSGGSGIITSSDGFITCTSICAAWYSWEEVVTLSAEPTNGSQFVRWSGPCSGTGPCQVDMTAHHYVTASFALQPLTKPPIPVAQPTISPPTPPPPVSTSKSPTATSLKISKGRERLRVWGLVTPGHAGQQVTLMLFRKDGVAFYRIARKRVTLSPMSVFRSGFRRPAPGRCRVIVRFDGDLDHLSSQASRTIAC